MIFTLGILYDHEKVMEVLRGYTDKLGPNISTELSGFGNAHGATRTYLKKMPRRTSIQDNVAKVMHIG